MQAIHALADHYRAAGDYASLANLMEGWGDALEETRAAADAYVEAAEALSSAAGPSEEVRLLYERALSRDPAHTHALDRLARLLEARRNYERLKQVLKYVAHQLQQQPASRQQLASVHYRLGQVYENHFGEPRKALAVYRQAIEENPRLIVAIRAARKLFLAEGSHKTVSVLYEFEIEATPAPADKHILLLTLARHQRERCDDLDGAVLSFRRAVKLSPRSVRGLGGLAESLLARSERGEPLVSVADRQRAAEVFFHLAQCVSNGEAPAYLRRALDIAPRHKQARALLESLSRAAGNGSSAPEARTNGHAHGADRAPGYGNPRATEPRATEPRATEPRAMTARSTGSRSVDPRSVAARTAGSTDAWLAAEASTSPAGAKGAGASSNPPSRTASRPAATRSVNGQTTGPAQPRLSAARPASSSEGSGPSNRETPANGSSAAHAANGAAERDAAAWLRETDLEPSRRALSAADLLPEAETSARTADVRVTSQPPPALIAPAKPAARPVTPTGPAPSAARAPASNPPHPKIVSRLALDAPRVPLEVNVGTTTDSNFYLDATDELLEGGVFVATYSPLPVGVQTSLTITLPGKQVARAHGSVILTRDLMDAFDDHTPGMCVAFEAIDPRSLDLVERFTRRRPPMLID